MREVNNIVRIPVYTQKEAIKVKKALGITLAIAASLLVSSATLAGGTSGVYSAPKIADADITIDGSFNDAGWAKATAGIIDEYNKPKWSETQTYGTEPPTDSKDASVKFKYAYSDKALYFMAEVSDDAFVNEHETAVEYQEDTLELYLDGDNSGGSAHEEGKHVQIRIAAQTPFAPNGSGHYQFMGGSWQKTGDLPDLIGETGKLVGKVYAGGWSVEMVMPWDELDEWIGTPGPQMGMDVQLNDNDEGDHVRIHELHWSGDGSCWQNPDMFGVMVLEGKK